MKRRDSAHEVRASRVPTEPGLMEEEQYADSVASAIEDARIETRKSGSSKDQEEAFGTLEDFQGKALACMVLEIPMKIAKKWLRFEIIHEYGTTAEALGFHAGTFTPRKVEKVLRHMLIRAQKTCEQREAGGN
jgi:hypothetical protein